MAHLEHSHGGHVHRHANNERRLLLAATLTGAFMVIEFAGGLYSGSLALIADAGHMLADFASLALAWYAFRLSRRPADHHRTYGFERMQVLVAFGNGLALFLIAGWIVVEAVHRLLNPVEVLSGVMFFVALAGLLLNASMVWVLHGADRENLNVRGAMVHVVGDLLGSAGVIIAAIVILLTGWSPADPLISVVVALLILRSAWHVVVDSAHVLLEGTPLGFSVREVEEDLERAIAAVEDIHHVHAWSITDERPMVTLHAKLCADADSDAAVIAIKQRIHERFGIGHVTVEVERGECSDAQLQIAYDYATRGRSRADDHDDDDDHHHPGHGHRAPGRAPAQ
jgi:cobalt-zinc-cadmium efflux system protein